MDVSQPLCPKPRDVQLRQRRSSSCYHVEKVRRLKQIHSNRQHGPPMLLRTLSQNKALTLTLLPWLAQENRSTQKKSKMKLGSVRTEQISQREPQEVGPGKEECSGPELYTQDLDSNLQVPQPDWRVCLNFCCEIQIFSYTIYKNNKTTIFEQYNIQVINKTLPYSYFKLWDLSLSIYPKSSHFKASKWSEIMFSLLS